MDVTKPKNNSLKTGALSGARLSRPVTESLPLRGFKTELDLNNKQAGLCSRYCRASAWIFNLGLRSRKHEYLLSGKSSSLYDQQRQLTQLKKETKFRLLENIPSALCEYALRDVDDAYKNFFRRVKQGKKPGFPRFKSAKNPKQSYKLRGKIKVESDRIKLPVIGWLKMKERDYLPCDGSKIVSATVSTRAGRWFVSVIAEVADMKRKSGEEVIGIDMGLKAFVALSDGKMIKAPKPLGANLKKLRRLQRHFSRQTKGGKNWRKTKENIGRLHYRIANIRSNFIHSLTDYLVKTYGGFVVEDLNVAGMIKNRHLARHIADVGWSEFTRQLEYKSEDAGIAVVKADRWYPSTKRCSQCGHVKDEMKMSQRTYECDECDLILDRDVNAARNLANYRTRM